MYLPLLGHGAQRVDLYPPLPASGERIEVRGFRRDQVEEGFSNRTRSQTLTFPPLPWEGRGDPPRYTLIEQKYRNGR